MSICSSRRRATDRFEVESQPCTTYRAANTGSDVTDSDGVETALWKLSEMYDDLKHYDLAAQSLDDLVSSRYVRELPVDPFTGQKDWAASTGDDPNSSEGEQGVMDVHSASSEVSSEGTPYSEW